MTSISFFPVRHHSVAASLALQKLANDLKPSAILIEGPYDFNPKIDELFLPHTLPIAIYSYVRDESGTSRGAYYPFCNYSPEWVALQTARSLQVPARFIDLPWSEIGSIESISENPASQTVQLYDDDPFWNNDFISKLCKKMGVSHFDDLWDELFEVNHLTQVNDYIERASLFCIQARTETNRSDETTCMREAFMANQIRLAETEFSGPILVVTGGYHTSALQKRISTAPDADELLWANRTTMESHSSYECGIALTPYSNARMDAANGYNSGMPSPGFYDFVWEGFQKNRSFDHRPLVQKIVKTLRKKGQNINSADRIASETMSRVLADLRGHKDIWRRDVIDGLRATLVKDEIARDAGHPLLDSISEVMQGDRIGRLAAGTSLPPIVSDIETTLKKSNLMAEREVRTLKLRLMNPQQREQSKILHRLNLLGIVGYTLVKGADMIARNDLGDVQEEWKIIMETEFHSSCIEASRYGATLSEAAAGVLNRRIRLETDLEVGATCLVDAALAGLGKHLTFFLKQLSEMIPISCDFLNTCSALDHIAYLYSYDEILKLEGKESLKEILKEIYRKCLHLLDQLGVTSSQGLEQAGGVGTIVETYERCSTSLELSLEEIRDVLLRVGADSEVDPFVRGAVSGAQWKLNLADDETILSQLDSFYDPSQLGDFLSGLFRIARETAQRDRTLLTALNNRISELSYIEFLEALPALRMAFTFFSPREKHHIGINLLEIIQPAEKGIPDHEDPKIILRAIEFERILFETASKFGVRTT
ncbi:hypothetical protein LEP1GSC060_2419 [Leptospira weilii serovar Ranarum str. ICFT]|uniref:Uncharacterized protein n=1 Tax=Leptospira weilii serovar Ranarum str. ICFT TaxID=1218598 RepID=N1WR07_9LEPT|nr:DUF5682 family protein [Leptospira weilii]EMY79534.1 hypothetical protein LEP1GSC060_2419 [Leptospira weilii serovar Ranarum str. ICFT]